jgi:hypothetical protein
MQFRGRGLTSRWWAEMVVFAAVVSVLPLSGVEAGQGTSTPRGRGAAAAPAPARSPGVGPVIVFETAKGAVEIETYPNEAPKSVAHILALVRRNFYNGLRIHRVEPDFVVQFGDPLT